MFDIGFWELILIGVIALIVFGPERLPAIASRIGHWIGRGRALARAVQMQLEQELEAGKAGVADSLPKFDQNQSGNAPKIEAKEPAEQAEAAEKPTGEADATDTDKSS